MARTRLYCYIGLLKSEVLFLRHELTKRKSDEIFSPKNHVHPFSISDMNDANKVHHQENVKDNFILSNRLPKRRRSFKTFATSKSGHFILHVGTNDLKFKRSYKAITKNIISIAVSLKSEVHNASASNIIVNKTIDN